MAKYYGDIPCVKIGDLIHITVSGTLCLCGQNYSYGKYTDRNNYHRNNIIWREIHAVTCSKCKEKYKEAI